MKLLVLLSIAIYSCAATIIAIDIASAIHGFIKYKRNKYQLTDENKRKAHIDIAKPFLSVIIMSSVIFVIQHSNVAGVTLSCLTILASAALSITGSTYSKLGLKEGCRQLTKKNAAKLGLTLIVAGFGFVSILSLLTTTGADGEIALTSTNYLIK